MSVYACLSVSMCALRVPAITLEMRTVYRLTGKEAVLKGTWMWREIGLEAAREGFCEG